MNISNIDFENFVDIIQPNFIGSIVSQKSGDILEVVRETDKKSGTNKYFEVKSLKYGNKFIARKCHILDKNVYNSQIEIEEFIKKEWPQNCGDTLKIIEKTNIKTSKGESYFRCIFKKYPYEVLARKGHIKKGIVENPKITEVKFINKLWPQKCRDILQIIEKTNICNQGCSGGYLWKCRFLNYPCEVLAQKSNIIKGNVDNPNLPWKQKESLLNVIQQEFSFKKPNIYDLSKYFGLNEKYIKTKINDFDLNSYVDIFSYKNEENTLKKYIESLTNNKYKSFHGKEEDYYYEIDIYLPELKIGFEYNGSYWHQEGKFKPINYHEKKFKYFLSKGILIFNIWDYFWFKDKKHINIRLEAQQYVKSIIDAFTIKRLPQLI